MKRTTPRILLLTCLAVVLLVITAFTYVSTVTAQLGNTGVPVRCSARNPALGATTPLHCTAADGTAFPNGTDVPSGHYLLVTDILLGPTGVSTTGDWYVYMNQMSGASPIDNLFLETQTRTPVDQHFTTPYFVLSQGQRLAIYENLNNSGGVDVWVSGLLTTNVAYAPLIAK